MFWGGPNAAVERATRAVRREFFVPASERANAGADVPLPIGYAQTISQPSLVRYMTEQLELTRRSRVLEVGTGSGYQTAILAEIASEVFTIERVLELATSAQERVGKLGYRNIQFRVGDGAAGWPEAAPFDAIIVTAAAEFLPPPLVEQLAPGGRLIAPIGSLERDDQVLYLVTKSANGAIAREELGPVRFVPLVTNQRSH